MNRTQYLLIKLVLGMLLLTGCYKYEDKTICYTVVDKRIGVEISGSKHSVHSDEKHILLVKNSEGIFTEKNVTVDTYYKSSINERVCFDERVETDEINIIATIVVIILITLVSGFIIWISYCIATA